MEESTLEGLTQRLDRLERENRRFKRVGFVVGETAIPKGELWDEQ